MGGIMVGAGATRYNLLIFGGTFWLVRLPLGWLLGHVLWGTASGVFAAMLCSQVLQTAIMFYMLPRLTRFCHAGTSAPSDHTAYTTPRQVHRRAVQGDIPVEQKTLPPLPWKTASAITNSWQRTPAVP